MTFKTLIFSLLTFLSVTAQAEARAETLLDCWDGTYAYGKMKIATPEGTNDYWQVSFGSSLQSFLEGHVPEPLLGWGNADVQLIMGKNECQKNEQGIVCRSSRNSISIAYDENHDSRRILRVWAHNIELKVTPNGKFGLDVALSFVLDGQSHVSVIKLPMPLRRGEVCL